MSLDPVRIVLRVQAEECASLAGRIARLADGDGELPATATARALVDLDRIRTRLERHLATLQPPASRVCDDR